MSQLLTDSEKRRKLNNSNTDESGLEEDLSADEASGSDLESEAELENGEVDHHDGNAPAKAGVIEKLVLRNFMCHEFFELEFGPQLNFIIGRNGSGKSAILTGISVGLGAKAADTNRGTSMKKLIKDGKNTARISITLKNEGPEAYKRSTFGSHIIIERVLQRQGTNQYLIKSALGAIISKKKAIIDEILARFNITVDNPLAFLSQDKAREFITLTTDHSKYNYFMTGTLLSDILATYQSISKNIVEVNSKLTIAKQHLEAARRTYAKSTQVFNNFKRSDHLRRHLELLHGKIYWYNVSVFEKKIQKYRDNILSLEGNIRETESKISELTNKIESSKLEVPQLQANAEEARRQVSILNEEVHDAQEAYTKIRMAVSDVANEIKSEEHEIKSLKSEVKGLEKELETETSRSKDTIDSPSSLESKRLTLKELEGERDKLKALNDTFADPQNSAIMQIQRQITSAKESVQDMRRRKNEILAAQRDQYAPWGLSMAKVINAINSTNRWKEKPIGPIGYYVTLKSEYSEWKDLINAVLLQTLDSFLVSNEHDRRLLQQIFRQFRINKNIITRKFEEFLYESGKALEHVTFLDMLEILNRHVAFTLIDSNMIEKCVTTKDRRNANSLITQKNVLNVFSLLNAKSGHRSTGSNMSFRIDPIYYRNDLHKLSSGSASAADETRKIDERILEEQNNLSRLENQLREARIKFQNDKQNTEKRYREIQSQLRKLADEIFREENNVNDSNDSSRTETLKGRIQELENEINNKYGILDSLRQDIVKDKEKFVKAKLAVERKKEQMADCKKQKDDAEQEMVNMDGNISEMDAQMSQYEMKKEQHLSSINQFETKIQQGQERLQPLLADAEARCPRDKILIAETDTSETISQEYERTQQAVQEAEKTIGKSIQEIQDELLSNKESKEDAEKRVKNLTTISRALQADLNRRFDALHTTILRNTGESASSFERSLALRGFKGELKFNFAEETLTMMVQTKNDAQKRTTESLSGGEKSFTQIALLLAIWKMMDSKVRGLDEFDVFMDSVNRSISIKLLLNELRQYPKSQSIFITPQDIAVVGDLDSSDVRIHRMSDPRNSN